MKHFMSLFVNEQDCLKAILEIHNESKIFEVDPMYYKGNFYKDIEKPKYKFDLNPVVDDCIQSNAMSLPLENNSISSIILDPPFLFGVHGKTKDYYSSKTHTIFNTFADLEITYKGILKEAYRILYKMFENSKKLGTRPYIF